MDMQDAIDMEVQRHAMAAAIGRGLDVAWLQERVAAGQAGAIQQAILRMLRVSDADAIIAAAALLQVAGRQLCEALSGDQVGELRAALTTLRGDSRQGGYLCEDELAESEAVTVGGEATDALSCLQHG